MNTNVKTAQADTPVRSIVEVQKIRRVPVLEGSKLVGIISLGDVHKAIVANSLKAS